MWYNVFRFGDTIDLCLCTPLKINYNKMNILAGLFELGPVCWPAKANYYIKQRDHSRHSKLTLDHKLHLRPQNIHRNFEIY